MLSLKLSFHDKCIGNIPKTKKKIVQKYEMTNYMVAPLKEFGFLCYTCNLCPNIVLLMRAMDWNSSRGKRISRRPEQYVLAICRGVSARIENEVKKKSKKFQKNPE